VGQISLLFRRFDPFFGSLFFFYDLYAQRLPPFCPRYSLYISFLYLGFPIGLYAILTNVMQLSYNIFMIVLDASAVILLAKIDLLEIFVSNFSGRVLIPEKVREEVCIEEMGEAPLIVKLIKDKKIQVLKVKNGKPTKKLMDDFNIDTGEAEAIILALQEKVSIIATDDRNAIRACKILKIEFTTAIAVLIRAFEKNLIDKDEALIKLRKLELVARYSRAIVEDARKRIEGGGRGANKNSKHTDK